MTLKNNRAPLLCCFQLCAWFHCQMWIKTRVRVRKRLSWVLTSVTLNFDLWPWPFAWTSLLTMVITPENFMMIRWWEHGEKGVTDRQTDGQTDRRTDGRTDGLNQSYSCLVAAKNTQDCQKLKFYQIQINSNIHQCFLKQFWCWSWRNGLDYSYIPSFVVYGKSHQGITQSCTSPSQPSQPCCPSGWAGGSAGWDYVTVFAELSSCC